MLQQCSGYQLLGLPARIFLFGSGFTATFKSSLRIPGNAVHRFGLSLLFGLLNYIVDTSTSYQNTSPNEQRGFVLLKEALFFWRFIGCHNLY